MKTITLSIFLIGLVFWGFPVQANMEQIKAYKETYPDAKPKCVDCHVDKMPKKADGQHDLNDYGKVVLKASKTAGLDVPTADTYKTVGSIEDFAKKAVK